MKTIYAVTGTINTSDAREKEQFSTIPDAWLDAWADVQLVRYKWVDRVLEKGLALASMWVLSLRISAMH
ncbi:tail fiber domain-containing protein [Achromobacter insuavis]